MKNFSILILIVSILIGCDTFDETNPKEVARKYSSVTDKNSDEVYELISSKAKEKFSLGEFQEYYSNATGNLKVVSIRELDRVEDFASLKRFEALIENSGEDIIDTTTITEYLTLKNENGKWRVLWNRLYLQEADRHRDNGDYESAKQFLRKAIELNPMDGEAYRQLGWCYIYETNIEGRMDDSEVLENFKRALELEPDNTYNFYALASYYSKMNHFELALDYAEKSLEYAENESEKLDVYVMKASLHSNLGELQEAEIAYQKVVEMDSTDAFAWLKFGGLMFKTNQLKRAVYMWKKAEELGLDDHGKQFMTYAGLAMALSQMSDYEESKKYCLRALKLEPDNQNVLSMYNYANRQLQQTD